LVETLNFDMSQTSESLPSQDSVAADPPSLPGSWLLGNAKEILRDTGALLTEAHDRLGPVYRVRVLWHSYLVIAGSAARDFIRLRLDEEHCSRHEFFAAIEREFGSADLSLAHSGERHSRLRQPLSLAYSRRVASPFVPEFVLAVSNIARRWAVGSTYCVMDEMQRLAFAQYCKVMAGDAADRMDFRDCLLVSEYGMNVGGRIWPESVFHLPWYRAAHRRSFLILRRIVAERRGKSPGAGGGADRRSSIPCSRRRIPLASLSLRRKRSLTPPTALPPVALMWHDSRALCFTRSLRILS
jgi:hypothetical protein